MPLNRMRVERYWSIVGRESADQRPFVLHIWSRPNEYEWRKRMTMSNRSDAWSRQILISWHNYSPLKIKCSRIKVLIVMEERNLHPYQHKLTHTHTHTHTHEHRHCTICTTFHFTLISSHALNRSKNIFPSSLLLLLLSLIIDNSQC